MTVAEIDRHIKAHKEQLKLKAEFDYNLANLVGYSIARLHNKNATLPAKHEIYTGLFDAKEEEAKAQERRDKLSVIRFKQFATNFNKRFSQENNINDRAVRNKD